MGKKLFRYIGPPRTLEEVLAMDPHALLCLVIYTIVMQCAETSLADYSGMIMHNHPEWRESTNNICKLSGFGYNSAVYAFEDKEPRDLIKQAFELGYIEQAMRVSRLLDTIGWDQRHAT